MGCKSSKEAAAKLGSPANAFIKALIQKHKVGKSRDLTSDAEVLLTLAMADEMLASPLGLDAIASEAYADGLGANATGDDCLPPNIILACKEAESRAALQDTAVKPCHLTVVFPMYHEQNRIRPKSEHENGQNFVRNKVRQMDWLVKDLDGKVTYDIIAVDDGCDNGSTDLMNAIIDEEKYGDRVRVAHIQEAIDQELEVFKPLKTPADSRKGGAVLYGLHLAATAPHEQASSSEDKEHLVLFTDSDLSGSMAMSGLVMSKCLKDGAKFASAARYGYPTSYLVTEEGATGHPLSHYKQPNVVHITIRHFIRSLLLPDLAHMFDTNVGFKCWRVKDIPELLKPMSIFGPAFDMQLLLGALRFYEEQDSKLTADDIIGVAPILFVEDFAESNFTSNSTDPDASAKGFVRMAHEMCSMHKEFFASLKRETTEEQQQWMEFIATLDLEKYKAMVVGIEKARGRKLPFEEKFTVAEMEQYCKDGSAAEAVTSTTDDEKKEVDEKKEEDAPAADAGEEKKNDGDTPKSNL